MIAFIKSLWRDKRGNALVIAGAALPLVVGLGRPCQRHDPVGAVEAPASARRGFRGDGRRLRQG